MSVPITYRQKMDFSSCVYMLGFPKYGHIYVYIRSSSIATHSMKKNFHTTKPAEQYAMLIQKAPEY